MNLIISSILENKFNVYVNLYKEVNRMKIENKKQNNILLIGGISVGLMCWSFLSFSAYILNEPLKEKVTNVKQMLLLSGANLFSYWVGLFIVDSIKFTIFILMIYPLFLFIEPRYTYFFILFALSDKAISTNSAVTILALFIFAHVAASPIICAKSLNLVESLSWLSASREEYSIIFATAV